MHAGSSASVRMTFGATVRQKAAAAACRWQQLHFHALRRQLQTSYSGEIRLPLFSHGKTKLRQPMMAIRVDSNQEDLLRCCELEYFGFFYPSLSDDSGAIHHNADVCIHAGPPSKVGYPYTLTAEAENFSDVVRRIEKHSMWKDHSTGNTSHPTKWITQPLLDGFLSRRVVAHVGLASGAMERTLRMAQRLKVALAPSELSPFYFANDLLSSWGLFGDIKMNDDVCRVVQLAHAATTHSMYRSLWMNGAALCNDQGEAVLILGPRRSGKTTLALHCLAAARPYIRLVGLENFHVAPNEVDNKAGTLLMSLPGSAKVGIGTLLGTLRPNPSLMEAAHTFHYSRATLQQLIRNSELTIWNMGTRYPIHIGEAFGPNHWCPTWLGRLKGIVLLNWNLNDLKLPHSHVRTQVIQSKSKMESLILLSRFSENRSVSLFKGHYLLGSVYDENSAMKRFSEALFFGNECETPPVYEINGSVCFDAAVELVCNHLLKPQDPDVKIQNNTTYGCPNEHPRVFDKKGEK